MAIELEKTPLKHKNDVLIFHNKNWNWRKRGFRGEAKGASDPSETNFDSKKLLQTLIFLL